MTSTNPPVSSTSGSWMWRLSSVATADPLALIYIYCIVLVDATYERALVLKSKAKECVRRERYFANMVRYFETKFKKKLTTSEFEIFKTYLITCFTKSRRKLLRYYWKKFNSSFSVLY